MGLRPSVHLRPLSGTLLVRGRSAGAPRPVGRAPGGWECAHGRGRAPNPWWEPFRPPPMHAQWAFSPALAASQCAGSRFDGSPCARCPCASTHCASSSRRRVPAGASGTGEGRNGDRPSARGSPLSAPLGIGSGSLVAPVSVRGLPGFPSFHVFVGVVPLDRLPVGALPLRESLGRDPRHCEASLLEGGALGVEPRGSRRSGSFHCLEQEGALVGLEPTTPGFSTLHSNHYTIDAVGNEVRSFSSCSARWASSYTGVRRSPSWSAERGGLGLARALQNA